MGLDMARVTVVETSEILASLPEITSFSPVAEPFRKEEDLFVCALGFEPRCLSIPTALAHVGHKCNRGAVIRYRTNQDDNEVNRPELMRAIETFCTSVEFFDADAPEFTEGFGNLLGNLPSSARATIDISVFGNRLVLRTMKAILNSQCSIRIVYSEALQYYPQKTDFDADPRRWKTLKDTALEHGVSNVSVAMEYPGQFFDAQPDYVIVFPSFTPERSWAALDCIDPSLLIGSNEKVLWVIGDPHMKEDKWRKDAVRINYDIGENTAQTEVSTFEYKETLALLDRIRALKWQTHNITIIPLGSKLQAVGIGLFSYIYPDVRLMLAVPKKYNAANYSDGCKAMWAIDFGNIHSASQLLSTVGDVKITD